MKPVRTAINIARRRTKLDFESYDQVTDTNRRHISYLKHKKTGLELVKKISNVQQGVEEVNILKKLNCDGFPRLIDFDINSNRVVLYTLKVHGLRWDLVHQNPKRHQHIVEHIEQVVENAVLLLSMLKNEGIVHGDVKPDNLFVDDALNVKLIDFGSAVENAVPEKCIYHMDAMSYIAPEIILSNENKTHLSDCYAMGKSLLELIGDKKCDCSPTVLDKIYGMTALRPEVRKKNFESFRILTCK